MRFVLDEDVDVAVVSVLVTRGHEAWSVVRGGLQSSTDEMVAVYAHEKDATVVTHDKEFSAWRRRHCIGRHLQLKCEEPDAVDVIDAHLRAVVAAMERYDDVFCAVSRTGFRIERSWVL